ncbi:MAG: EamA family transporter [Spirochaetes bacterium]|nr:MAG: EamA family transporter [Spirochaetota bacterium]
MVDLKYIKLILVPIFWGSSFVAVRAIAFHISPFTAAFFRFLFASLFLLGLSFTKHGSLPNPGKKHYAILVFLGLTGIFSYNYFFFSGLKIISAGRATVIVAFTPALVSVFSTIMFRERLTVIKIVGLFMALAGTLWVVSKGNPGSILKVNIGKGELYIFGCVVSWTLYSLIGKIALRELTPLTAITYSCLIGMVALILPAFIEGGFSSAGDYPLIVWIYFVYLGVFTAALAFIWYYEGIQKIGPTRSAVFINMVPLWGIVLGIVFLGEEASAILFLGAILVIVGVYLTNKPTTARVKQKKIGN